MKKVIYIIFCCAFSLNAQQTDSINLEKKVIDNKTSIISTTDSIVENKVPTTENKKTKSEVKAASKKGGFF